MMLGVISFVMIHFLQTHNEAVNTLDFSELSFDTSRYIAHAGGVVDGYVYTNSLEALNQSYEMGFKLFELDIQTTSDKHFVAVHDWKSWKKATQFSGNIPPTRAEFLSQKMYGKFTPLDLAAINQWFAQHADAVLVTDKTNDPVGFSSQFTDLSRLKMELFTWNAVNKAIDAGVVSPMPNGHLLSKISGDKVIYLKQLGISEMVISRKTILKEKALMKKILNAGIRIYAYHIKSNSGLGEQAVMCREIKWLYGIYADTWNFKEPLNCQNFLKQNTPKKINLVN